MRCTTPPRRRGWELLESYEAIIHWSGQCACARVQRKLGRIDAARGRVSPLSARRAGHNTRPANRCPRRGRAARLGTWAALATPSLHGASSEGRLCAAHTTGRVSPDRVTRAAVASAPPACLARRQMSTHWLVLVVATPARAMGLCTRRQAVLWVRLAHPPPIDSLALHPAHRAPAHRRHSARAATASARLLARRGTHGGCQCRGVGAQAARAVKRSPGARQTLQGRSCSKNNWQNNEEGGEC